MREWNEYHSTVSQWEVDRYLTYLWWFHCTNLSAGEGWSEL